MTTAFAGLHLVLVEPSAAQARHIAGQLEDLGIRLAGTYATGREALAAMAAAPPDVVLSALYLPDMAGTELVAAMRADTILEATAFVLVSSETRPQALEPVRQSGACAILPKPFDQKQLRKALAATRDYLDHDRDLATELDLESLRVLLVDDSAAARKFLRRVLENLGIDDFIEAGNGREAAEILGETMVDLVVTDYNMPEMDGRALVEHIRHQGWQQSVPILMVTSEADSGRLAAVEEAGVSGICDKPFEPGTVKRLLQNILSR